ncbi:MAG: FtsW/RodA/SpoVE family cell cycle protein, partial [Bacteroidales bacterium]|nr:FtsW/RodA/SpoVE family cell cycle protein [Bacteroidales bacterium]
MMKGDSWVWGIYIVLLFISVVEMASATSRLTWRADTADNPLYEHTQFLIAGFFGLVFPLQNLLSRNVSWLKYLGVLGYVVGIVLMGLLPFFGRMVNGARRDIFHIQPVEIVKVGLILLLVSMVTIKFTDPNRRFDWYHRLKESRKYWVMLGVIGLACFLIMLQNLSSALILGATCFGIMLLGGVKLKYLGWTVLTVGLLGSIFYGGLYGLHAYHVSNGSKLSLGLLERANTWEDRIFDGDPTPLWEQRINDDNMQVMSAHMAIANSNGMGTFVGNSVMRDHLPEAYSDYIYAIIFEETGILGAAIVMLLYFILFFRCFYLSLKTQSPYKRLLMVALPLLIIIQALIHM